MTREQSPRRARRAELTVALGAAAGALFMADQVGAQQSHPFGFETLTPAAQAEVAQCGVSFANVMSEVPATPAAGAPADTIIATHIVKEGDTLMNMARACLGITPEQTAADPRLAQAVGMLVKDMAARNPTIDPNSLTLETPITMSVSEVTRLKADLGLSNSAQAEPQQTPVQTPQPTVPEAHALSEHAPQAYEVRVIGKDAAVDIRALQASVGPDQIALLIWDTDSQEVARQVGEFVAKRKVEITAVSPVVVYAIARANHDRMPPSVQQGMDRFESKLVELATGKTPQEVQAEQEARLAQAEYADWLALNHEKTRIAQEVYGTGAHTTYDGYVLDTRGNYYLTELGTFVQITDQLTRTLVLPENALTPNDLSNFQEGYRLHSVATGEVPMGILRARLEDLRDSGELYRLSDTPHDPETPITPEVFDRILVRETREMIAIWGGDPQALRVGVALPMPGKFYPTDEQISYAQRVITHNRSAGSKDEAEQLLHAVSVMEFLTRVQEQFPGLASEEMAQLAIILKEHPSVQLADLHDAQQVRGVIQQYLPSVNHGPSAGGEQYHNTINALMTDPTMQYLMRDTAGYMIVSRLIQDLLESGATDPTTIGQAIKDTYTAQYASQIRSASARPHEEGVQYLVDILKINPQLAAALLDRATASADLNQLATEAMQSQVEQYTQSKGSIHKTENMGPGGGPNPEDEVARIRNQLTDPTAIMFVEQFPEHARALIQENAQLSIHELQPILFQHYVEVLNTEVQTSDNQQDLLARLQRLTNVSIEPYRQFLLNNSHNTTILINYLTEVIPQYAKIAPQATQSKDILARLKPEVFIENEISQQPNDQEAIRIAFTIVAEELSNIAQAIQTGAPAPEDAQTTYTILADLMGKTILDNMLLLPYGLADSRKQTLDIITTGAARYQLRVDGTLPEGIRSTLTPEQSFQIIKAWSSDPVADMYMSTHPEDAASLIHESFTQRNHDMQTILNSLATKAEATLRSDLARATTPQERIAAMQKQAPFDIAPFESELLSSLETDPIFWVLQTIADDAAEYAKIREVVEASEDALARIDIATYDEIISSSLSRPEAIQRTFHIIEQRIREGAVDLTNYGQITDPTVAETYKNIERLWGTKPLRDWLTSIEDDGIETYSSAEIIDMITVAYMTHAQNKELRSRRASFSDMPITPRESVAYDAVPPDDTDINRVDDGGAGSETAGKGNGVEVESGDTLTQPLVEPDRRGDNAVEVPPTGHTNPSEYNPDGTPITPEGHDAMSEPMVTPDMSNAMAFSDGPIVAASAQPATLPDGSVSLSDAMRKSQGETTEQPPLTFDQVMKIIAEDGPAIEAYIATERDKFGPDMLALQVQLHEYIQANPDEVHRIIVRHMPTESSDTYWVWEEIDLGTRDAIIKALLVTAAAAAAAGAALGNTLSGGGV